MNVIRYTPQGTLYLDQSPLPKPRAGEALVRVYAFGLNRADLLQKKGLYPAPKGVAEDILGLEFAGEVVECLPSNPKENISFKSGDRVMGIVGGGAYAEYVCVPWTTLLPIPKSLSYEEAAALPEAYLTAFDALFNQALCPLPHTPSIPALLTPLPDLLSASRFTLSSPPSVLIHAIGSGVGLAAAHLTQWLKMPTFATTRSLWKKEKAQSQFPNMTVWLSESGTFIPSDNPQNQVDIILDFIGGSYFEQNIKILKKQGTLVGIGLLGGSRASLSLGQLLAKRLTIKGTVLRSRSILEKQKLVAAFRYYAEEALEKKELQFEPLHAVYSIHQIEEAHQELEHNQVWSKSVISWMKS